MPDFGSPLLGFAQVARARAPRARREAAAGRRRRSSRRSPPARASRTGACELQFYGPEKTIAAQLGVREGAHRRRDSGRDDSTKARSTAFRSRPSRQAEVQRVHATWSTSASRTWRSSRSGRARTRKPRFRRRRPVVFRADDPAHRRGDPRGQPRARRGVSRGRAAHTTATSRRRDVLALPRVHHDLELAR